MPLAQLAREEDIEHDTFFCAEEGMAVSNNSLTCIQLNEKYVAGEIGGEGSLTGAPVALKSNDEDSRCNPPNTEHAAETAAGGGVHVDGGGHPGHGAGV